MSSEIDVETDWAQNVKTEMCPECGSKELHHGYGFGAGGLGSYTICLSCDHTFNVCSDPEYET